MDRTNLQPLSGFRDYSGSIKDDLIFGLREIFLKFGYLPLETPSIERQELLLKDYGDEAQKLLYLFEDNGKRKVGLRYDLTIGLSRFTASNFNELNLPYKRFEIGNVWRAERAQKGRLRQFTQADVDIVGSERGEEELLEIVAEAQKVFGLNFELQLNDRRILDAIFSALKVDENAKRQLLIVLDKKTKLSDSEFAEQLSSVGLSDVQLSKVRGVFVQDQSLGEVGKLVGDEKVERLLQLLERSKELGLNAKFMPSMVRGLDYYTGPIFECFVDGFPGSVVGGGRYDSLVEGMISKKVPAVGLSFGIDRLEGAIFEKGLNLSTKGTIFIAAIPETFTAVQQWASQLRDGGKKVEVYLDSTVELGKQIKYADKNSYSEIYIPLPEEWEKGKIIRKNLSDGSQQSIAVTSLEKDDSI